MIFYQAENVAVLLCVPAASMRLIVHFVASAGMQMLSSMDVYYAFSNQGMRGLVPVITTNKQTQLPLAVAMI